jgi:outer membrane protein assembly factor BamB
MQTCKPEETLKKRSEKLDLPLRGVNLAHSLCAALLLSACATSPTTVAPGTSPAYGTILGNQRRALYEDEAIPMAPQVAWDVNAGSGMRGTLVLLDSTVLTATTNRQMLAFHRRSGQRHWDQRFNNAVTSTVLYDRNTIYVATDEYDGAIFALNIARGRDRWKRTIGPVRFTPLLENGVIYAGTDGGAVAALHTENGAIIWRVGLRGGLTETLVSVGSALVAFTNTDSVFALRKVDGGLVARAHLQGTPSAAPALHGTTIIVPTQDTAIVAIDANTLAVLWRARVSAPVLTAPVVTADGSAYAAARDGALYRIAEGRVEKIAQLEHAIAGSLTLARGHLLLGSYDGTLLAVSLDGQVVWKYNFNDSVVAPVAVGDQSIYVPLLRGRIVKLR